MILQLVLLFAPRPTRQFLITCSTKGRFRTASWQVTSCTANTSNGDQREDHISATKIDSGKWFWNEEEKITHAKLAMAANDKDKNDHNWATAIIIHGSAEATNNMEEFSKKTLGVSKDKLFAPRIGECVDATTESHIYQVKLKDSLMSSVVFSQAKDAELAWVDGQIHFSSATSKGVVGVEGGRNNAEDRKADLVPVLDGLPQNQVKGHRNVFINPPRLSDFKQALTKAGIQAEFSGGVLVCNGVIALRRAGGKICLEGTICEDYYRVRQLLYEQFAII